MLPNNQPRPIDVSPLTDVDVVGATKSRIRSFQMEVGDQLEKLRGNPATNVDIIGTVQYGDDRYPLYRVELSNGDGRPKPTVLLSAGVHGNEPAGVHALLRFMRDGAASYLDQFNFIVYPCVNPSGFELNYRWNRSKTDLNRSFFDETKTPEARLIVDALHQGPKSYLFAIDMHESLPEDIAIMEEQGETGHDAPDKFYMYEVCPDHDRRIGDKIIGAVEPDYPVCKLPTISGDTNSGGVIWYPEGAGAVYTGAKTLESYVAQNYSPQVFTTESYTSWPLDKRIELQLKVLTTALELWQERKAA